MPTPLKKLLTGTSTSDGNPLFPSIADLAGNIAKTQESSYANPKSVGTQLGYVIKAQRACPAILRDALVKAVTTRIGGLTQSERRSWLQQVGEAIDLANAEAEDARRNESGASKPDEKQFAEMSELARSSVDQFIITPTTAEESLRITQASVLNNLLLELLGIFPLKGDSPQTSYRFLLPSRRKARRFWNNLLSLAEKRQAETGESTEKVAKDLIIQRLCQLDEGKYLRVYVVPSFVCGCPIVVYNTKFPADARAFSFAYHPDSSPDVIQWDDAAIRDWFENVYDRFRADDEEREAEKDDSIESFSGHRFQFSDLRQ